jgi:dihydroflavonol-4-reductase
VSEGVFVTGGSGFLGGAIVERLVARGRRVVALARSPDARRTLEALGAEPAPGDVRDRDSLERAMRGCSVAFHVAGVNAFCLRDNSEMFAVNVVGSAAVIEAAARARVGRIVYTSSAASLGEAPGTVGDESTPHRGWFLSHYERSKFEGERAASKRAAELGVELVTLNPSSVQGPGRAGGTARLLTAYLRGRLRVVVASRVSLVDIADCAEGHLLGAERGVPGRRYVLSGATLTTEQALQLAGRIAGVSHRPRRIPGWLAAGAAAAVEVVARARGSRPPVCREMVRTIRFGHAYDGSRASRELGLVYRPVEDTLRRAIAWQRAEGIIPPD